MGTQRVEAVVRLSQFLLGEVVVDRGVARPTEHRDVGVEIEVGVETAGPRLVVPGPGDQMVPGEFEAGSAAELAGFRGHRNSLLHR